MKNKNYCNRNQSGQLSLMSCCGPVFYRLFFSPPTPPLGVSLSVLHLRHSTPPTLHLCFPLRILKSWVIQANLHQAPICAKRRSNCESVDHMRADCKRETACYSCQIEWHRAGSMTCPIFRALVQERRRQIRPGQHSLRRHGVSVSFTTVQV